MMIVRLLLLCALLVAWAPEGGAAATGGAKSSIDIEPTTAPTLEEIMLSALAERSIETRGASVELFGSAARLAIPARADVAIDRLTYQASSQRFTAVIATDSSHGEAQRFAIAGRLHYFVEVPVLTRRISAGEVIQASDIDWTSVRDAGLPANAIFEPRDLIGWTPRRSVHAGTQINASDLRRPVFVAKGTAVTLVLNIRNMQLTARGQVLDDGAIGETVRVVNIQSHTIVSGVVLANGQIAVGDVPIVASR
jgi:flagellar basal body P-ring formation protein FlgA